MWLELYERWLRVFSEGIPWAVTRGHWRDVVHVLGLVACSVGLIAGVYLLRRHETRTGRRRYAVGAVGYGGAQWFLGTSVVYFVFLAFGWEGIFRGYPSIFAGVMIAAGTLAILVPRIHYLLVGERLLDEFAVGALYGAYSASGKPTRVDPGAGVRLVSLAAISWRAGKYLMEGMARGRGPNSGENVFAFSRRLHGEALHKWSRGSNTRRVAEPQQPTSKVEGSSLAPARHEHQKTVKLGSVRNEAVGAPHVNPEEERSVLEAKIPPPRETVRAVNGGESVGGRGEADAAPVGGSEKHGEAEVERPRESRGNTPGVLRKAELDLEAMGPWGGHALRCLREEGLRLEGTREHHLEEFFEKSRCLTLTIARQTWHLKTVRYAEFTERMRSQGPGAKRVTIPLERRGRPMEVLLGTGAKSLEDPEFTHWLGTGFLMAGLLREVKAAGGWQTMMLCREKCITTALEPDIQAILVKGSRVIWLFVENDRGTEEHDRLKGKFLEYREVLRRIPDSMVLWVAQSESRGLGILDDAIAVLPAEMLCRVLVRTMGPNESVLRLGGGGTFNILEHLMAITPEREVRRRMDLLKDPDGKGRGSEISGEAKEAGAGTQGEEVVKLVDDNAGESVGESCPPEAEGHMELRGNMGVLVFPGYVDCGVRPQ